MHGSFIIGLPEDTEKYALDTYQQILSQDIPLHSWNFYPLVIYRQNLTTYSSDIEKNFELYGYTEDSEDNILAAKNTLFGFDKVVNWKNKNTSFHQVTKLSNFITKDSYESSRMHIAGQFAMTVSSMGDPRYDFETVRNTAFKDFNFYDIEENVRKKFVSDYKQKLFNIVAKKQQK